VEALNLKWGDFEDSVQYVAGKSISAEYIITRNPQDFSKSQIKTVLPKKFVLSPPPPPPTIYCGVCPSIPQYIVVYDKK
jgi:anthranilate/para-aminobenzoate synthase component II